MIPSPAEREELKPYSEERIIRVLDNLVEEFKRSENENPVKDFNIKKITVNLDSKMVVLSTDDILYIEADEKETHIFTSSNMYTSKLKISQLENILSENTFFTCVVGIYIGGCEYSFTDCGFYK